MRIKALCLAAFVSVLLWQGIALANEDAVVFESNILSIGLDADVTSGREWANLPLFNYQNPHPESAYPKVSIELGAGMVPKCNGTLRLLTVKKRGGIREKEFYINWPFIETDFDAAAVYGANVFLSLCSNMQVGVRARYYEADLTEHGRDIGTLEVTPIVLTLKFGTTPNERLGGLRLGELTELGGFGARLSMGLGVNLARFERDPLSTAAEKKATLFTFELGCGVDYFFTRNFSAYCDIIVTSPTKLGIKFVGPGGIVSEEEFHLASIYLLFGIAFHF